MYTDSLFCYVNQGQFEHNGKLHVSIALKNQMNITLTLRGAFLVVSPEMKSAASSRQDIINK